MKKYKVTFYNGSASSVKTKKFDSLHDAIVFAAGLMAGDVLEIKRIEDES